MDVAVEPAAGVTVLRLTGELDAATCDLPVATAARVVAEAPPPRLVVDLAGVTFFGSSGIGTLVRIRTLCHDAGMEFLVRGLRPQARKLLVLTGLDGSFGVAADMPS